MIWHMHQARLRWLVLVAAAYAVVAFLGDLVAIFSPGPASVIWPAAGVALAGLLVWGGRCWPGVLLGAFLAYLYVLPDGSLAAAGTAAVLATLQAVLGARMTRRYLAADIPLTGEGDIWRFLLLGGPLACLFGATLGVPILMLLGQLPEAGAVHWWFGWWAGHALGVLLFAPLALIAWPGLETFRRLWGGRVALPLLITAGLLAAGHVTLDRLEHGEARAVAYRTKVDVYEAGFVQLPELIISLRSVERLFAASEEVTRREFAAFTTLALDRPGLLAVEWVPRVAHAERAEFEAAARREGIAGFRITERDPDGVLVPAGRRDEYFPGYFVEPLPGNEATLGFDFGSGPARRAALERARDSGLVRAAEAVLLIQTGRLGMPVFVPVYRQDFDPATASVAARGQALRGFVLGAVDLDRLFEPLSYAADRWLLAYRVTDATPGYPPQVLRDTLPADALPEWSRELEFAGRILRLELESIVLPWQAGTSVPARAYLGFAVITASLVGFSVLGTAGRYAATAAEVAARTAELRVSEQNLEVTLQSIGDAVLATDTEGRITRLNPVAEQLTGWSLAEARGRAVGEVFTIIDEQTRLPAEIPVARVLTTGKIQGLANHTVLIARDGSERAIADSAAPIQDPDGGLRGVVLVFRDISEERTAQQALAASERRYREFIELSPYGVFVQCGGRFVFLNRKAVELLGAQTEHQLLGRPVLEFLHPDSRDMVRERIRRLNHERVAAPALEEQWLRLDGSVFHGEATAVPYEHQGQAGALVLLQDITERRNAQAQRDRLIDELIEARCEAENANRAKSAFLAAMSHEIRTPMNGVVGLVDVLAHSKLSEHQADLVRTIRRSAVSLLRLIDDILDFSKIEAGRLELEQTPVSVAELIEGLCSSLVPVAARKQVELTVFVSPEIPERVLSDEVRLRQIVYNLVGNAIKFSADQPGRVSVRAEIAQAEPLKVLIRVADNGIGMAPETVAQLFQAFTQAEVSTTRRFGGTGLGLAICKRLVDLMDGEITVSSVPGEGSVFTVTLPFAVPAEQPPSRVPDLSGLACILVESVDLATADLRAYLEHAGAHVTLAADVPAAARAAAGCVEPVVVIRSMGSSRWSANEALAAFGEAPHARQLLITRGRRRRPRVQAQAVVTLDGDALRRQALLRAVAVAAGRASPEIVHEDIEELSLGEHLEVPSVAAARARGRLILVAEDDEINQKVILQQLALLGHAAEIAEDGAEALRMWREGHYGLLITDLHMPEMDGYQLAAAIRREEAGRHRMPIVALTANALRGEEQRSYAAGIDQYLTKPAPLQVLRAMLEQWLPGGADPSDSGSTGQSVSGDGDPAVLDVAVLQALVGADEATVREFLGDYRVSARTLVADLQAAAGAGDARRVATLAHKLKSASRSVGALTLGDRCAELEAAGKIGDRATIARKLPLFSAAAVEVEQRIARILGDGEQP